jgi:hypothetical protein
VLDAPVRHRHRDAVLTYINSLLLRTLPAIDKQNSPHDSGGIDMTDAPRPVRNQPSTSHPPSQYSPGTYVTPNSCSPSAPRLYGFQPTARHRHRSHNSRRTAWRGANLKIRHYESSKGTARLRTRSRRSTRRVTQRRRIEMDRRMPKALYRACGAPEGVVVRSHTQRSRARLTSIAPSGLRIRCARHATQPSAPAALPRPSEGPLWRNLWFGNWFGKPPYPGSFFQQQIVLFGV